ncbi:MAG: DUF47 domain-containing protein [Verrucomicrobiales bacterium]|nr:DUF47 domain-containing protein [Verrucomicrobiales bacterium]
MKFFKKEQQVTDLALEYLTASAECVQCAQHALDDYLHQRFDQAQSTYQRVDTLETKADNLRRDIGDLLSSGAYLPLIRGDIYSLIEACDRVPNAAESCVAFFVSEHPEVPEAYVLPLQNLVRVGYSIFAPLQKAVTAFFTSAEDLEEIKEAYTEITKLESEVDDMEWELTINLFQSDLDLARKQHLKKALDRITHLSDKAEDAADLLHLLAVKSVL